MNKYIIIVTSFIRGLLFKLKYTILKNKNFKCGKYLFKYKNVVINLSKYSKVTFGNNVKIMESTQISSIKKGNLCIQEGVSIGKYNTIVCHDYIEIGKNTIIAANVSIYDHDHIYNGKEGVNKKKFNTSPIVIGEGCWIGTNVVLLKGTKIGNRCVVGAGSVLKGIYPDDSLIIQNRETYVNHIEREN